MDTKEQQFTEIIRMYERTIYTVCHMFSDNTDEVNDLYQEILVRLWKGFDAFKGKSDIKTWIYRVSLNYCINFHNKQKKEQEKRCPVVARRPELRRDWRYPRYFCQKRFIQVGPHQGAVEKNV